MKKIILTLAVSILALNAAEASSEKDSIDNPFRRYVALLEEDCDACGCSANGGSMGFSSMLNSNFVGIRYIHQSYKSRDGVFNNSPWIDENFNTAQLWARVPITERIEVMALVPYHFNNREKATGKENIDGLGDITLMGFYTLFGTKSDSATVFHKFQLGAGVKAPTGKYDSANNGSINPSFQLGTGSWDYTLASEYTVKKNNLGLNATVNYVFKTENEKNYQFGNQFNYAATLFYSTKIDNLDIVPQLGLAGEKYDENKDHGEDVPLTAGDILFGKMGVELGLQKFSLGLSTMLPINQNLTGGRVEANYRWSLNLNYSL
ncbi:transporter [Flavobacterium sp. WW92]|uniref:transporter n=1 Tax=unclassified Flavobacterium TaxID=196869 RepID=UPI00222425CE|nr:MULTISPECIES: transporter [unclassified Flavobacterium]WDO11883.1 transporter [Flavobacterium sp. WW92]